jgi:cytochrome c-type biogenesis protein CcmE
MTRNYKFGVGALLLVAAIGYLMFAGVQQSSMYYFTIDEFVGHRESLAGQGVRVAGRVAAGSLQKQTTAKGTEMKFRIHDFTGDEASAGEAVPVEYTGVVPDMFAEGRDVIIEGKVVGGTLQAQSVMTSCPSKYEAEAGEQAASN